MKALFTPLALLVFSVPVAAHTGTSPHLNPHADDAVWSVVLIGMLVIFGAANLIRWRK